VQAWLPAREIVERALAVRKEKSGEPSGRVLVFDEYASWKVREPQMPRPRELTPLRRTTSTLSRRT
jgi:hypothetical protein